MIHTKCFNIHDTAYNELDVLGEFKKNNPDAKVITTGKTKKGDRILLSIVYNDK